MAAAALALGLAAYGGIDQAGGATQGAVVWLCRPGSANDPCAFDLTTTVVPPSGARRTVSPRDDAVSPFDCFYVYPTVSRQPGDNANLTVQLAEVDIAVAQAAPFSQVCRVWAPMYRQRTLLSLEKGLGAEPRADEVAYQSLLAGWQAYLGHDNHDRPFILIGHSQGAAMLIRLLASQIDDSPGLRARLVAAILAGGNVTVPAGRATGASFRHIPLCGARRQTGCVVAFSSFPSRPPADAEFGRPGQGVSLQSAQTRTAGVQVACVNPAAIGDHTADLDPLFPANSPLSPPPSPPVGTPWVSYPSLYSATCRTGGGASWLQVTDIARRGDSRPVISELQGPAWGYHGDDINLALGSLVRDVATEEDAYRAQHHP